PNVLSARDLAFRNQFAPIGDSNSDGYRGHLLVDARTDPTQNGERHRQDQCEGDPELLHSLNRCRTLANRKCLKIDELALDCDTRLRVATQYLASDGAAQWKPLDADHRTGRLPDDPVRVGAKPPQRFMDKSTPNDDQVRPMSYCFFLHRAGYI